MSRVIRLPRTLLFSIGKAISFLYSLFPFPLSQVLPWAFGYYENSVAMRVSPFRRSRIYAHETFSTFRCPFASLNRFVTGRSP